MAVIDTSPEYFFKAKKYKDDKDKKFPSHTAKKDDKFYLEYFNAIYSAYVKDKGSIPYSKQYDIAMNRLFGDGSQPVTQYMDILCPLPEGKKIETDSDREGWMNISWDIVSPAPKLKRAFTGKLQKIEHEVICSAVNEKAIASKEDFKWNLWTHAQQQQFYKEMDELMGVQSETPEWMPESMQELEMFMDDCFKLKAEMAFEMGLDYTFYLSKWSEIKKRMLDDFFENAIAACQDYVDPIDGKVKTKYLDIARLILPFSRDNDFSNIPWWGYVEEVTIGHLRQVTGLSDTILAQVAQSYLGYGGNPSSFDFNYWLDESAQSSNSYEFPFDSWKTNVMFGEFIASENKTVKIVKGKDGARRSYEGKRVDENEWTSAGKENREIEKHKYQVSLSGWWIIGTDYTYQCGKSYVQPRPDKKNPKLSLNAYRYGKKSLLESIIPNLHSFQLSWLKLQNALVMAAPDGLAIDIAGMEEGISIGDQKFDPLSIAAIRLATGDYLYKSTNHYGEPARSAPILPIKGGMGTAIPDFVSMQNMNLQMMGQLTGINETIDASSPQERVPVKTSEMAFEAANATLQPIYSGYVSIKDSASKKIVTRYQALAANGDIEIYYPALGKNVVQVLKITSDMAHEDMAIKIRMKPTDEMKQAIRLAVMESVKLGKNNGGITQGDGLFVEDILQNGNLKYARMYLDYKIRTYSKEAQAIQDRNMQLNQKGQQETEQLKMEGELAIIEAEKNSKMEVEGFLAKTRKEELMIAHKNTMEEIAAQNQGKLQNTVVQGTIDKKLQDSAPAPAAA